MTLVEPDRMLSVDFIGAEAGDREMSAEDRRLHERIRTGYGERFHSDLLVALTSKRFEPAHARAIWARILEHKVHMSATMGRNVGVAVAALDYLTNVDAQLGPSKVVLEKTMEMVSAVALKDGLTGLYVRRAFELRLHDEIQRSLNEGRGFSLLLLDVDDFKRVNDRFGHRAGDTVLQEVAKLLRAEIRASDVPARLGGDEMAVLLSSADADEALETAERIRHRVRDWFQAEPKVTVSGGVASFPMDGSTPTSLFEAADAALYHSKRSGRNCCTLAGGIG